MTPPDRLHAVLAGRNRSPRRAWFVPGRIEVLGKHTDYAGGRSLLCAVDRGFHIVAAPRDDRTVTLLDPEQGLEAALELDGALPQSPGHWTAYPRAVARSIARHFPAARRGADIVFTSNLPTAAGISSSSAFLIAAFLALAGVNELEADDEFRRHVRCREDLAGFLAAVESGYTFGSLAGDTGVGILGGSEDHTAILCCEAGRLAVYSFTPVRHERSLDLDPDLRFVVGSSGIVAEKAGAAREAYNRASIATKRILELWNQATLRADRSLGVAATSAPDAPDRIRRITRDRGGETTPYLLGRFDQFFAETEEIVPAAAERLAAADYEGFGALVDRSQALAEQLLRNQVPQTIDLARNARRLGALAASAFGGGFGGSVWALVRVADVDAFIEQWSSAYRRAYPDAGARAVFFATTAGPAAREL
jgi:galactokinase